MKKLFIMAAIATMAVGVGGWLAVPATHAVDISVSPTLPNSQYPTSSIGGWVNTFYQFSLLVAGVLAFGAVVFGGVKYLASAGNPSAQSEGKEWIKGALIGLALLAAAYIILDIVNPAIVNLNVLPLQPVNITAPATQTTSNGTIQCGGTTSGACPSDQTCVNQGNSINPNYQCVANTSFTCGGDPPNSHYGPCQNQTQTCVNTGGSTKATARYQCQSI